MAPEMGMISTTERRSELLPTEHTEYTEEVGGGEWEEEEEAADGRILTTKHTKYTKVGNGLRREWFYFVSFRVFRGQNRL